MKLKPLGPLPCPFCEGTAITVELANIPPIVTRSDGYHVVRCVRLSCYAQGPIERIKVEAVAAWNRRGAKKP